MLNCYLIIFSPSHKLCGSIPALTFVPCLKASLGDLSLAPYPPSLASYKTASEGNSTHPQMVVIIGETNCFTGIAILSKSKIGSEELQFGQGTSDLWHSLGCACWFFPFSSVRQLFLANHLVSHLQTAESKETLRGWFILSKDKYLTQVGVSQSRKCTVNSFLLVLFST